MKNTITPKVYIIVLNYKTWEDTLECLESLYKLDYQNFQIVVVDNASPNDSISKIIDWAEGKIAVEVAEDNPLKNLSFPNIPKPLDYILYNQEIAEKGGNGSDNNKLILIQSNENRGYSAGNNIGIRYALAKNDFEYVWILNNDTVVETHTLSEYLKVIKKTNKTSNKIGAWGNRLLYYDNPNIIQGTCGQFNKWLCIARHIDINEKSDSKVCNSYILKKNQYLLGASLLLDHKAILDVGLLCEDYFLFYEEPDLMLRLHSKGYKAYYADSINVYHKESITVGGYKSIMSDYYVFLNKIPFTKKFYPSYLPTVYLAFIPAIINRIRRKQFDRVVMIIKIVLGWDKKK